MAFNLPVPDRNFHSPPFAPPVHSIILLGGSQDLFQMRSLKGAINRERAEVKFIDTGQIQLEVLPIRRICQASVNL